MKKNAIIFGDSYSTFDGYIPHGYDSYYPDSGTGVTQVCETWWSLLCEKADLNLVLNDSWSGSTIGYTSYDGYDSSRTSSFIFRLRRLIADGFFTENEIDTVFVFGGTNDSWSGAPLGEEIYENWLDSDFYNVLPACAYFLHLLKETLPQAKIYCLINTDLHPAIDGCMKTACEKYGVTPVTFDQIDKISGHPTVQGMNDIKNGVLTKIK